MYVIVQNMYLYGAEYIKNNILYNFLMSCLTRLSKNEMYLNVCEGNQKNRHEHPYKKSDDKVAIGPLTDY